jgi:hypothetical protein
MDDLYDKEKSNRFHNSGINVCVSLRKYHKQRRDQIQTLFRMKKICQCSILLQINVRLKIVIMVVTLKHSLENYPTIKILNWLNA